MEKLNHLKLCNYCGKTLHHPVLLTCGTTICLQDVRNLQTSNYITLLCRNCNVYHSIDNVTFPRNILAEQLLEVTQNKIEFCNVFSEAKKRLEQLKIVLEEFKTIKEDPATFLTNYFTLIRSEVELMRKSLVYEAGFFTEKLLGEINTYENDCKKKIDSVLNDSGIEIDQNLNRMHEIQVSENELDYSVLKPKLDYWEDELKHLAESEISSKTIEEKSDEFLELLDTELKRLESRKNNFLLNKSSEFKHKYFNLRDLFCVGLNLNS
jgi:hypothetical protein